MRRPFAGRGVSGGNHLEAQRQYATENTSKYADTLRSDFMKPENQAKLKEKFEKMSFIDYLASHEKSGDARGLIQGSFRDSLLTNYPGAAMTGGLSKYKSDPNSEVSRSIDAMSQMWPGASSDDIWKNIAAEEKKNPLNNILGLFNGSQSGSMLK